MWEAQTNSYNVIIVSYCIIAMLWLLVYFAEAKWAVEDSASNLGLFGLALFYAFRMVHLHYIQRDIATPMALQLNLYGTLAAVVFTYYKNRKYFKHINNFLHRLFRK